MTTETKDVDAAFKAARWQKLELSEDAIAAGISACYGSSYAVVAFAPLPEIGAVLGGWLKAQEQMMNLRRESTSGLKKDLYLIFIVNEVPQESIPALRDILNDTQICRKVCVQSKGRSFVETLSDLPFLNIGQVRAAGESSDQHSRLVKAGLSEKVLQHLAKRGAATVFHHLKSGEYFEKPEDEA